MIFVLDTNVLSSLIKHADVPEVRRWMEGVPEDNLYTASMCVAEILAGISVLPSGRRRQIMEVAARPMFDEDFRRRVFPFDHQAGVAYADMLATRRRTGLATHTADLIIAATALANGAAVVTRDTSGFQNCGVPLVNPWLPGGDDRFDLT